MSGVRSWARARVVWPCGHVQNLELTSLPERLRRRRAVWVAVTGSCTACWEAEVLGTTPAVRWAAPVGRAEGDPAVAPGVVAVSDPGGLAEAVEAGAGEVQVVGAGGGPLRVRGCGAVVVSVAPGAAVAVAGAGEPVRSWGRARVAAGGRVAGAPGSVTRLVGGCAAVGDRAELVACSGRAVVGAGAVARVEPAGLLGPSGPGLEVWACPGALVLLEGRARLVTRTVVVGGAETVRRGVLPEDLGGLLALAESLPVRRRP